MCRLAKSEGCGEDWAFLKGWFLLVVTGSGGGDPLLRESVSLQLLFLAILSHVGEAIANSNSFRQGNVFIPIASLASSRDMRLLDMIGGSYQSLTYNQTKS